MQTPGTVTKIKVPEEGFRKNYVVELDNGEASFLSGRHPKVKEGDRVLVDHGEPKPGYNMAFLNKITKIGESTEPNQIPNRPVRPSWSKEDSRDAFINNGVTRQFQGAGAHGATRGDIRQAMQDWAGAFDEFHGNVTIVSVPKTPAKKERVYSELNDEIPDHL